jgi:hypothetical protein
LPWDGGGKMKKALLIIREMAMSHACFDRGLFELRDA